MKELRKRASYLQGLLAGLDLDMSTKEGRLLTEVVKVMDVVVDALVALQKEQREIEDYLEDIDEDLNCLENDFYESEEDEDIDDDDEEEYIEVECPECHEEVCFDTDVLEDEDIEVTCPNCGAVVFINESECEAEDQSCCRMGLKNIKDDKKEN